MKKLTVLVSLLATIVISLSFINDDPRYKNLKILPKNTTHEQMDSIMKHFSKSLGVKCDFCHARSADNEHWDFASDANDHKGVARYMMKMTTRINKKFFKDDSVAPVTCYTCHNGQKEPAVNPPKSKDDDE